MGRPQPGRGSAHAIAAPQLLSLMAPVLGPLRALMPRLPRLEQVLVICPPPGPLAPPEAGGAHGGAGGSSPTFAYGVARALVASCLDR
jgi:hypothetical protein